MAIQTQYYETGDYAWKSWSNGYKIHLTLTEEYTDAGSNASLISYKFSISSGSNNRFTANYNTWTINIGGNPVAITNLNFNLDYNQTQVLAQGQVWVAHNADGTLNMYFRASIPNNQTWNEYAPPDMTLEGNMPLTNIAVTPKTIPVVFNGTQLNSIVYNGQQVSHLVYNGVQIY
jgi:hypothetical protein